MVHFSLPEGILGGVLTHTPPMSNRIAFGTFEGAIVSKNEYSFTVKDQREKEFRGILRAFHSDQSIRRLRKGIYLR